MSTHKQRLAASANRVLGRVGLELVRVRRDRDGARAPEAPQAPPPPPRVGGGGEAEPAPPPHPTLRPDHPRLLELKRRYAGHPATAHSVWNEEFVARDVTLPLFRRDNAYVWQSREFTVWTSQESSYEARADEVNYILSAYYARSVDRLGLLERLADDGAFGAALVAAADGWTVSRDLLDSVLEINFLARHLDLAARGGLEILDIGAGYGRLAHRLSESLDSISRVLCTDAVAESTFVSEFYLRFRGAEQRTEVVPLDEIEQRLSSASVTIATNVCSFSECPLSAIAWWLELLARNEVPYLYIVANTTSLESTEADGQSRDYKPLLRSLGYRELVVEPKYAGSAAVQRHGIYPAYHHLYGRGG